MAATCPVEFDTEYLRQQVRAEYQRVALEPHGEFHFHRGAHYAHEYLKYAWQDLDRVPALARDRFAGVGNPHRIATIYPGETVLDHACGAGMDLIIAARRAGPGGRAIGVDMTPAMRENAAAAAELAGLADVIDIRAGVYEDLPAADDSVDVVISNGVINLAPDKRRVFSEIHRVLRPGGRVLIADVVVQRELKLEARRDPDIWAACIGGALPEWELAELAAEAGFVAGRITERFDCFRNTPAEHKVSPDLHVQGVNFFAIKRYEIFD
ncbi:MAG: methyltransferase domain-containing protein [Gammaproteobacteria bacterium]|nr:methyltransferase domain-containing protein [Gammaproteobacteria bacterium]